MKTKEGKTLPKVQPENHPPPKDVKPPKPEGKTETRLFQSGPHERAWLTKEEATEKGHFWKD